MHSGMCQGLSGINNAKGHSVLCTLQTRRQLWVSVSVQMLRPTGTRIAEHVHQQRSLISFPHLQHCRHFYLGG